MYRPAILAMLCLIPTFVSAASVCNGHAELCQRSYGNITFLGAHDSYAVGSSIADNQSKDVKAQLDDGIRTLQVQTHNADDGIHLCHTSCSLLDGGLLSAYLSNVSSWVSANPTEVITIVLVNIDSLNATQFSPVFDTAGLTSHMYKPPSASLSITQWPTLGVLIDAGTTVMVFMDFDADFASVPTIMDEFSNVWEDAYDVTETSWGCAVNRSSGNTGSTLMLINHFLDTAYSLAGTQFFVPNKDELKTTNAAASLEQHVGSCMSIWGRKPNHILLDFYDTNGNEPFDYVAQLNSVSAPTNTISANDASNTASQTAVISQSSIGAGSSRVELGSASWALSMGLGVMGLIAGGMSVWA